MRDHGRFERSIRLRHVFIDDNQRMRLCERQSLLRIWRAGTTNAKVRLDPRMDFSEAHARYELQIRCGHSRNHVSRWLVKDTLRVHESYKDGCIEKVAGHPAS